MADVLLMQRHANLHKNLASVAYNINLLINYVHVPSYRNLVMNANVTQWKGP